MKVWPGKPYPLGATYDGAGTNFSIFSEAAEKVELCLFAENGQETRVEIPEVTGFCRHGYLPEMAPGQRYGFRVHGPGRPSAATGAIPISSCSRDPYAKAVEGEVEWNEAVFPHRFKDPGGSFNEDDSAPYVPKSVVINPFFDWEKTDEALLEFTRNLIRFRSEHPVFMRRGWFLGRAIHGSGAEDIGWFTPDGIEMAEENGGEGFAKSISVFLNGMAIRYPDLRGEKIVDDSFFYLSTPITKASPLPCRALNGGNSGSGYWTRRKGVLWTMKRS